MIASRPTFPPIEDYAIIGDCRTAALIARDGSLDWWCAPRFDSPALFAALLDRRRGGTFRIHPSGPFTVTRRYVGDTNVLETTFVCPGGRLRLTDLMPVASEREKRRTLRPEREILRIVEGLDGAASVDVLCDPRPKYGADTPALARLGSIGYRYQHRAEAIFLRSEIPLEPVRGGGVAGRATLRAGERRYLSVVHTDHDPIVIPAFGADAEQRLATTLRWWREWADRCEYDGPYRLAVMRSALTLKLMSYAPSGAVVAAPTTSLPEQLGGVRNWDYRYCWLRDASLTLQALADLGHREEAHAFMMWILHATRLTSPELQVVYDVHGETELRERDLEHLEGYCGSRPVRVGNGAEGQFQLDTYGEVIDAVCEFVRREGKLDRATRRLLVGLGDTVCRRWREPDEGIWELRVGRRQHTYSKVMCWIALDRLLKLHDWGHVRVPVERYTVEREAIREAIETRGYDSTLGCYVSELDGQALDASLLLLSRYGYADARSPRMRRTVRMVEERLGTHGLLYRYLERDGLPPGEGAFGICGFWAVDCEARAGSLGAAAEKFERLSGLANDVGLFAEQIDPESGAALGNFPQAFTHVGLIDAALTLQERGPSSERSSERAAVPSR